MLILKLDLDQARQVFGTRGRITPEEMQVALAFKTPIDADRIINEEFEETFGDGHTSQQDVQNIIHDLTEHHVLRPADPADTGSTTDYRFSSELSSLGRVLEGIAGDLTTMGAWAQESIRVDGQDPLALLASVRDQLTRLRQHLWKSRQPFVDNQLSGFVRSREGDLCLHLGCGSSHLDGWINIDMVGADVRLNLCWELPFASASVRYIYSAHTFEHLDYHTTAQRLLQEMHRVLVPGGTVRLAVPDIGAFAKAYATDNQGFFQEYDRVHPQFASIAGYRSNLSKVMRYAGSAVKPSAWFEHRMGYDFQTLSDLLRIAGFQEVEQSQYQSSRHASLRDIDSASTAAIYAYDGISNTLFVEATK
jgi:predicted SAM-dependent methyltransferase